MLFDNLRHDTRRLREIKPRAFPWYVIESLLFENGYQAVVLHRIAHWFRAHKLPVGGPLFSRLSQFLTGIEIGPGAEIGPGLFISHGTGLVIGGYAKLGARATLLHQVTIGSPSWREVHEMPVIGDDVFIAAGAKIIGKVTLGDGVFVGVNALVVQDVPARCKVFATTGVKITTNDETTVEEC